MNPNLPPLEAVRAQVTDWLLLSRSIPAGAIIDSATPAVVALRAIMDDAGIIVTTLHEGLTDAEAERDALRARAEAAERDGETWRGFAGSVAITVHGPATGGVITNHLAVDDLPDLLGAVEQLRARAEAAESERDALRAIVETAVHHLGKSVPYFGNAETLTYSIIAINVRNNLAAALGGVHQSEQADAHVRPVEGA
jgi:hypothetical protein